MPPRLSWSTLLPPDYAYRPFLLAGMGLAVAGGFVLAILLSADAAEGFHLGTRWVPIAQAHGHLQIVGFVGLVIAGVALRVVPRFAGRPDAPRLLIAATLLLIFSGVVLRGLGQPLGNYAPLRALMALGAWLELGGALAFGAALAPSLAGGWRKRQAYAPFLTLAVAAFAAQALLGAIWITEAAIDGDAFLAYTRNAPLLLLQVFGFAMLFVLGVGMRAFPNFFGRTAPPFPRAVAAAGLIALGLLSVLITNLVAVAGGDPSWQAAAAGWIILGVGTLAAIALTGAWRSGPHRLRPPVQPLGRLIQLGLVLLATTAGILIWAGSRALVDGHPVTPAEIDAARHLVALGVLMPVIAGMMHIVLPDLAIERLGLRSSRRRAWILGVLWVVVAGNRVVPSILDTGFRDDSDYWHWVAAAAIGLAGVAWLGWILLRAIRRRPMLMADVVARIEVAPIEVARIKVPPRD